MRENIIFDIFLRNDCDYSIVNQAVKCLFQRSIKSMYIEWWLHNIGYYLTKPLCKFDYFKKINLRCKDVDLEEWSR